jgi:hypothetical protein
LRVTRQSGSHAGTPLSSNRHVRAPDWTRLADFQYAVSKLSSTPILDLEEAPPKPPGSWPARLIGVIIGLVISAILILADQNSLPQWHWPAFNGLLLFPALYVVFALHEIGHFVAGKLVGLDAGGISVGPFAFAKSGKNWRFRFDWRTCIIGGFFTPLTTVDVPPLRYVWLVAGGPLASIVLTVLFGLICAQYGSGAWSWIGSLFWTSLFSVIISLIPVSSGLNKSDGARLWQLLRYPERARSWMALLALQTDNTKGLRPREWNRQLFEQILTTDASASEYLHSQLLAFYRRLDEGLETQALVHLEIVLARSARVGKVLRHALFLEAASTSALICKRAVQARSWRERACKLRKPESLDVVDAGIAMCEGRYEEAAQHWEAARAHVVRRKLDSGLIRFVTEKWAEYEAVCRAARE